MNTADIMSPNSSPGAPGQPTGVRRVNRVPLFIASGIVLLFSIIIAVVAQKRASSQIAPQQLPSAPKITSTSSFAAMIAGPDTGLIPAASTPPPEVRPAEPVPTAPPQAIDPLLIAPPPPGNLDLPPLPGGRSAQGGSSFERPLGVPRDDEDAARFRQLKQQQFEAAVKANSSVPLAASPRATLGGLPSGLGSAGQLSAVRSQLAGMSSGSPDGMAEYQARLARVNAANGMGSQSANTGTLQPPMAERDGGETLGDAAYSRFGSNTPDDRWRLHASVEPPRNSFVIRAGAVIPATLISGINSEIPGLVSAQVSQNVYDTATGKNLLIPQGSRLIGPYSTGVGYGQSRLLMAWQRITFPDAKTLDLGAMPGADAAGNSGFTDQVNNHYLRLFASAFLMSGVTAGISYSQRQEQGGNGVNYRNQTAGGALSEALGQQLGQVTSQLIAKNMSIAPTLEIRPGYRFNVVVTKDLVFQAPYKAFDYQQ